MRAILDKKGSTSGVSKLVGIVVLIILISALAPIALVGLFNTTAFNGVPAWVPSVLGILGVIGFIYIMLRASGGK